MRIFKLLPVIILLSCFNTKEDRRTIFIKAIGWQFQLPVHTLIRDSSFDKHGELTEAIPSEGPSVRLFKIKDSILGSFDSYLRKDKRNDLEWRNWHDSDTKWYFEAMREVPKQTILNTEYSAKKIDSIDFLVQHIYLIRKITNDTGHVYHYFGKIKDNELDISFEFFDKAVGEKYMQILNSSKFRN